MGLISPQKCVFETIQKDLLLGGVRIAIVRMGFFVSSWKKLTTNRLTFMQSLVQLRMMNHEKTMRQMVEEIHRGKLNIDQAAAKFETTRKTVQHWIELVEEEGEIAKRLAQEDIPLPPPLPKRPTQASSQPNEANQVGELKAKVQALEEQLQTAKFKVLYYATLVQVSEQELGIDIEKKSVTKPSGFC